MENSVAYWAKKTRDTIQQLQSQPFAGIPTMFPEIDDCIPGLVRGATTYLAGAPGMGKTAFITNLILRNVGYLDEDIYTLDPEKQRILMVSCELGESLWIQRIISLLAGIPQGDLLLNGRRHKWQPSEKKMMAMPLDYDIMPVVEKAIAWIETLPICLMGQGIVDTQTIEQTLLELVSSGYDIPLVAIDHAGVLADVGESDASVARSDEISRRLGHLAQTYNTHVISIWPLTKVGLTNKKGQSKMPSYSALRGSVMPAYQAANIIIIHSPQLAELQEARRIDTATRAALQISIQKNRFFGKHRIVEVEFIPSIGRIEFKRDGDWLSRYRKYRCPFAPPTFDDRGGEAGTLGDTETGPVNTDEQVTILREIIKRGSRDT